MEVLSPVQIQEKLALLPEWQLREGAIVREFSFPDFVVAMEFVNRVAEAAEAAAHHPDIDIRWNKVRLALASHDAGGLTEADFHLAATIQSLVSA
jgi:4a-hydroxytetrahydrobiopterin dehydratase